jgi:hypothetical protein
MANLLEFILSLDALQLTALGAALFLIVAILIRQKFTVKYPDNLPRVRENGRTRFSLRTRLAYYTDCKNLFSEAYETVCPSLAYDFSQLQTETRTSIRKMDSPV